MLYKFSISKAAESSNREAKGVNPCFMEAAKLDRTTWFIIQRGKARSNEVSSSKNKATVVSVSILAEWLQHRCYIRHSITLYIAFSESFVDSPKTDSRA